MKKYCKTMRKLTLAISISLVFANSIQVCASEKEYPTLDMVQDAIHYEVDKLIN